MSPGGPLRGEVRLPGDKSLSHRAALLASVAEGQSRVDNFLVAGVTRAALGALTALGVGWRLEGVRLTVEGRGPSGLGAPRGALDCGSSATTLRLLAGLLAGAGVGAVLDGSPGLRRRPMGRLVEPLRAMGACLAACDGGHAPLALEARPAGVRLKGLDWRLPAASAQLKSALLLAGLWAEGPVTVREPGPSRDHTERLLSAMGALVAREGRFVSVRPA